MNDAPAGATAQSPEDIAQTTRYTSYTVFRRLSGLIGDHDVITKDRSVAPASRDSGILGGRVSISSRLRRERIFDAAELAATESKGATQAVAAIVLHAVQLVAGQRMGGVHHGDAKPRTGGKA